MPVIIGKISPDRANRTPTRSEGNCFPLKGLKFDRRRSIYYSAYYTAKWQNEKMTSHGVACYNFFVIIIRSVDQQRNSPPKTLTSLNNRRRGVEKLPDLLRSDTKDVIIGKKSFVFLDSGQFISSIHCEVGKSPCK